MKVELLDYMGSDLSVANAARVSFDKESSWQVEDGIPEKWEVGQRVRYVRDQGDWGPTKGDVGIIEQLSEECAHRKGREYQVFWVRVGEGIYWTTPNDVILDVETGERLSERDTKLIDFLARHNHWSPFAHTSLQFRVKAPIFVARQLGKHQVGLVWNEVSRRYVDTPPEFYTPETWRKRAENKKQGSLDEPVPYLCTDENGDQCRPLPFKLEGDGRTSQAYSTFLRITMGLYDEMIASGVCPEQARMVLPQSMYTEWIWTGSLYAFARVVSLRDKTDAQKETQVIARMIAEKCAEAFPVSWEALTTKE